jgi:hypothetical protein
MSERKKLVETLVKRLFLGVLLVLLISVVVGSIFVPLSQPRISYNHRRAILSITKLRLAESTCASHEPSSGSSCELSDLGEQGLLDTVLASGTKSGYHFEIRRPQSRSENGQTFAITGVPVSPGTTGKYAFCTDRSEKVWYSESGSVTDCLAMRKPVERMPFERTF